MLRSPSSPITSFLCRGDTSALRNSPGCLATTPQDCHKKTQIICLLSYDMLYVCVCVVSCMVHHRGHTSARHKDQSKVLKDGSGAEVGDVSVMHLLLWHLQWHYYGLLYIFCRHFTSQHDTQVEKKQSESKLTSWKNLSLSQQRVSVRETLPSVVSSSWNALVF